MIPLALHSEIERRREWGAWGWRRVILRCRKTTETQAEHIKENQKQLNGRSKQAPTKRTRGGERKLSIKWLAHLHNDIKTLHHSSLFSSPLYLFVWQQMRKGDLNALAAWRCPHGRPPYCVCAGTLCLDLMQRAERTLWKHGHCSHRHTLSATEKAVTSLRVLFSISPPVKIRLIMDALTSTLDSNWHQHRHKTYLKQKESWHYFRRNKMRWDAFGRGARDSKFSCIMRREISLLCKSFLGPNKIIFPNTEQAAQTSLLGDAFCRVITP